MDQGITVSKSTFSYYSCSDVRVTLEGGSPDGQRGDPRQGTRRAEFGVIFGRRFLGDLGLWVLQQRRDSVVRRFLDIKGLGEEPLLVLPRDKIRVKTHLRTVVLGRRALHLPLLGFVAVDEAAQQAHGELTIIGWLSWRGPVESATWHLHDGVHPLMSQHIVVFIVE